MSGSRVPLLAGLLLLVVDGRVGVSVSTSSSTSRLTGVESSGSGVATTGGVGVVWMF